MNCELPIRHSVTDHGCVVGCLSPELRGGVRTRHMKLELSVKRWLTCRLDGMAQGMHKE